MKKLALLPLTICVFGFSADKPTEKVDRILILKSQRKLQLLSRSKILKEYKVALGSSPIGPKQREGDGRTPEGLYSIDYRKKDSQFHRALHISYPNKLDRERAAKAKVNPGGMIMIHGIMNGYGWVGSAHRARDWTLGCIAVTNQEIEEIWNLVPDGTTVEIRP
jgi:murein L,D-transpeptidase YafK